MALCGSDRVAALCGEGDMLLVSVKVENRLFDLWIRKIVTAWRGGGIM